MKEETRDRVHLTPTQVEPEAAEVKNVGVTLQEQLDYLKDRPYKAMECQHHKDKFAEKGFVWLVVQYENTFLGIGRKFSNARQFAIDGLENQGIKNYLYDKLWEDLRSKYPHARLPE